MWLNLSSCNGDPGRGSSRVLTAGALENFIGAGFVFRGFWSKQIMAEFGISPFNSV